MTWQHATHMHTTTTLNALDRSAYENGAGAAAEKDAHCGKGARLNHGLGDAKSKVPMIFALLLALPVLAICRTDPLSPAYLPAIDTKAADYPSNIWITDTLQKVRQDSGSPGTQHWGTFYGTQNEFVDFQVQIQAPAGGYSGLSVITSDFVNSRTGTHILASSTNIVVYREAYVHVQGYPSNNQQDSAVPGGTNYNTFYGGALGYYPDILIPTLDPYWHQTTNAWPFNVAAGNNQSAWIDVLIPSNAPSGYYLGTVTVKNGTTVLAMMPIIIAVWQWPNAGYMPSTSSLHTLASGLNYNAVCTQMFSPGSLTASCGAYPGAVGDSDSGNSFVSLDASLLMKDHRYGLGGQEDFFVGTGGNFATWNTYVKPLMTGACIPHPSAAPTCPVLPNSTQTVKLMDILPAPTGCASNVGTSSEWSLWQSQFTSNGWGTPGNTPLFYYLCDEPGDSNVSANYRSIYNTAKTYHAFLNPGIPLLLTNDIWFNQGSQAAADTFSTTICGSTTCLQDSEDIMVPAINVLEPIGGPIQPLSSYRAWLRGSVDGIPRQWWSYGACSSSGGSCVNGKPGPAPTGTAYVGWPVYAVDAKPAANRAMEWLTFMHGQTGELYYDEDYCMLPAHSSNCVPSGVTWDPWSGVYAFGQWGDGTLFYVGNVFPGSVNYMGSGVTTPIILPSVRLKHIRDGVQDYEYLTALTVAGKGTQATVQINSWITNSYTFETSGVGLRAARLNLGTIIHQLTYPISLQPPTSPAGKVQ